jgi:hypothetical protein
MLFCLPAAAGLFILAEPITLLLFSNAEAGYPLAVSSWSVIPLCLYVSTTGIMQGLGRPVIPVLNMVYGGLVKTVLAWYLTAVPALHVGGCRFCFSCRHGGGSGFKSLLCSPLHRLAFQNRGVAAFFRVWLQQRWPLLFTLPMGWCFGSPDIHLSPSMANGIATVTAIFYRDGCVRVSPAGLGGVKTG